jgi:cation diffusion facilitator CzcD-associated flavoprotein CzcO
MDIYSKNYQSLTHIGGNPDASTHGNSSLDNRRDQLSEQPNGQNQRSLIEEARQAYHERYLRPSLSNPSQLLSVWSLSSDDVIDCCIVGSGQTGISVLALARGLPGIKLAAVDKEARGQESIWRSPKCRMPTLRTPLTADVSLGISTLSMRRWWSSQSDTPLTENDKLPTHRVNDYLDFVRDACDLNAGIDWETELVAWEKKDSYISLTFRKNTPEAEGRSVKLRARALIIADGIDGVSVPNIPERFRELYDPHKNTLLTGQSTPAVFHTQDYIPCQAIENNDILVIGGGASAYDAGIASSTQGAKSVTLVQRGSMPKVNFLVESKKIKQRIGTDPFAAFPSMSHSTQIKLLSKIAECRMPPPEHTVSNFESLYNARRRLNTDIDQLIYQNGKFHVKFSGDNTAAEFDTIILGTGYKPTLQQKNLYRDKNIKTIESEASGTGLPEKYVGLPEKTIQHEFVILANESTWTSIGADPGLTSLVPRAQETVRALAGILNLGEASISEIIPPKIKPSSADLVGEKMIAHLTYCLNNDDPPDRNEISINEHEQSGHQAFA